MTPTPTPAPSISDLPEFLRVDEFCAVTRISRGTVYDSIRRGLIPAVHFGARGIRIPRAFLVSSLSASRQAGQK
jgi:excisionase family DNA binding protein